jgi:hypothetical protein
MMIQIDKALAMQCDRWSKALSKARAAAQFEIQLRMFPELTDQIRQIMVREWTDDRIRSYFRQEFGAIGGKRIYKRWICRT